MKLPSLRKETDPAIIACHGMDVPVEIMENALSLLRKEGNFIKKYRGPADRFAYLQDEYGKIQQQLAARRGQALRSEATGLTAGSKDREGRIQTVEDLISTEKRLGEGVNPRARADVEELKREQLAGLAKETDTVLREALNNSDRNAKKQAVAVLLEEARLLQTHFFDTSRARLVQLGTTAQLLLTQISEQTDDAVAKTKMDGADDTVFRDAFRLIDDERSLLGKNRELQTFAAKRTEELSKQRRDMLSRAISRLDPLVTRAKETKLTADIDAAQKVIRLLRERIGDYSENPAIIAAGAQLDRDERDLAQIRTQSTERDRLMEAGQEVAVQEIIDPIRQRFLTVNNESPLALHENEAMRQKMLSQMQKDLKTLEDNLSRGTEAQKIRMQSLMTDISSAIWEKLQKPEEREQIYRRNLQLMIAEAKAKSEQLGQPVANPTVTAVEQIIKDAKLVLTKAQSYADAAPGYRVEAAQLAPLQTHMNAIREHVTRYPCDVPEERKARRMSRSLHFEPYWCCFWYME